MRRYIAVAILVLSIIFFIDMEESHKIDTHTHTHTSAREIFGNVCSIKSNTGKKSNITFMDCVFNDDRKTFLNGFEYKLHEC